jgi:hypothetical protein
MHKKVLAQYKKYNAELPDLTTANEENIRIFYEKTKASGKPIRREITKIVRLKEEGKEWFYYGQELRSQDSLGNEIEVYMQPVGKYDLPEFSFIVDPHTDARIPNGIKSTSTVYELEWPKEWTPELEKDVSDNVDLVLIKQNRHYGGYSFDEFKLRTFDELVTLGKYGTLNPTPKIIEIENTRRKELDKEKKARI